MELVIIHVIIFAIDIVIASIITKIITKPLDIGTLRIDTSDPDGPFMFLELSKDVDTVASKKYVILKVNLKSYISQK